MTDAAREVIGAYRRSHDAISAQVESFREEDLLKASGATEWNVAKVLSHLGSSSEIAVSTLRSGAADPAASPAIWARWDAMVPEVQAAEFVSAEGELVAALEALDDESLGSKRIDMGFLPMPVNVATFVAMRLSEVGLHRWDVDVAFRPDAAVASYLVPILLHGIPPMVPMLARPKGLSGTIAFDVTDPVQTLTLHITEGDATMTEGGDEDASTVVCMPAESFVRLTSGRLRPENTPRSVQVEGEHLLDEIRRIFPGY
jgi:uncharacterized protein (TIGR03083 family)